MNSAWRSRPGVEHHQQPFRLRFLGSGAPSFLGRGIIGRRLGAAWTAEAAHHKVLGGRRGVAVAVAVAVASGRSEKTSGPLGDKRKAATEQDRYVPGDKSCTDKVGELRQGRALLSLAADRTRNKWPKRSRLARWGNSRAASLYGVVCGVTGRGTDGCERTTCLVGSVGPGVIHSLTFFNHFSRH